MRNANVMALAMSMNAITDLTNTICNHYAPTCYWWTLNCWPWCQSFSVNANILSKTWCKPKFLFFVADAPTKMEMQNLFMMVLVRIFIPWCKCLLVGISWCKWPLVGMQWCKCSNSNTNYSKIPFIFKIKAYSMPETNIFSNLDLLFPKSHLLFLYLRLPKKIGDHY